jgi:rhomboid protease GluP
MEKNPKNSLLCPNCRRLISADEPRCPHCGIARPGSKLQNNALAGLFREPGRLINTIIYANAGMFVISILLSAKMVNLSPNPLQFLSPDLRSLLALGATGVIPIDRLHRWWSLLSANYLHGGILHIFFNMVALRQIAGLVIREYGAHRTFLIYTYGGIAGCLISYLAVVNRLTLSPAGVTIGSSAAVCSLIGAALYYGKRRGGVYGNLIYRQIGGWVLAIFVFGFLVPGIDNWAHGGGIAAGIAIGFILGYQEITRENRLHRILAYLTTLVTAVVLLMAVSSGVYYRYLA